MKNSIFTPLKIREINFRNRIFMSPMCQYSAKDGVATDWHHVHLTTRAIGGVGLVIVEATAIEPEGRITQNCLGLWNEKQVEALQPIVSSIKSHGAVAGIQIAHAGRKASSHVPWKGGGPLSLNEGAWQTVAPSAIAYAPDVPVPNELSVNQMQTIKLKFVEAASRALAAGFEALELHMAHGYLMHEFLSPLSNVRTDQYGGSLQNRMRFPIEVAEAVREVWPAGLPLFARISATDWVEGGWDVQQSILLCKELEKKGVDFIDVSSGGNIHDAQIKVGPHYQLPFAEAIKANIQIPVGSVGMITDASAANQILIEGKVDAVLIGRELLRNPYWALHAARSLAKSVDPIVQSAASKFQWPNQYARGK